MVPPRVTRTTVSRQLSSDGSCHRTFPGRRGSDGLRTADGGVRRRRRPAGQSHPARPPVARAPACRAVEGAVGPPGGGRVVGTAGAGGGGGGRRGRRRDRGSAGRAGAATVEVRVDWARISLSACRRRTGSTGG